MNKVDTDWRNLSLNDTISRLKQLAKDNELIWEDELNADFSSEIEFMLTYKGRWLLCHIGKIPPFTIRYRLVGDRNYERVKPKEFIPIAKEVLLH